MNPVDVNHISSPPIAPEDLQRERLFPELESPIAKSARLLELFQAQAINYPQMPLCYNDKKAAARCHALLHGLASYADQRTPISIKLGGHSPEYFKAQIISAIRKSDHLKLQRVFLVGSAASWVVGRAPLVKAVTQLAAHGLISSELYIGLEHKARSVHFDYNDLDFQITVEAPQGLEALASLITELELPEDVTVHCEGYNNYSILRVELKCGPSKLDFMVYAYEHNACVTYRSQMRVDLLESDLPVGRLLYCSQNPWAWALAHLLGVSEVPPDAKLSHYFVPRIVGSIVQQGTVCTQVIEAALAEQLSGRLKERPANEWSKRLSKYFSDHAKRQELRAPMIISSARLLMGSSIKSGRVREICAQLMPLLAEQKGELFLHEAARLVCDTSVSTPHVLAYLQVLAGFCLLEGVQDPCTVKLLRHNGGEWFMRLRMRKGSLHWDLLLPFQLESALKTLAEERCPQQALQPLLHVFWNELRLRDKSSAYNKQLAKLVPRAIAASLRKALFGTAQQMPISSGSLFVLLATHLDEHAELVELLAQAIKHNHGSKEQRTLHGWAIVEQLSLRSDAISATKAARLLFDAGLEPPQGRLALFVQCVRRGYCHRQLLTLCSPPGCDISWNCLKQTAWKQRCHALLAELDASQIDIQQLMEIAKALHLRAGRLSEARLVQLGESFGLCSIIPWLEQSDSPGKNSAGFCLLLKQILLDPEARAKIAPGILNDLMHDKLRVQLSIAECRDLVADLSQEGAAPNTLADFLRERAIDDEAAWELVANLYSMQGQGLKQLGGRFESAKDYALWCEVSQLANSTQKLVSLLKGPLKGKQPPGGRAAMAIAWFLNWPKKQVPSALLAALIPKDVHRINWESICAGTTTALTLLEKLGAAEHLNLYTLLLLALHPKKISYSTRWANLMCKRLEACDSNEERFKVITARQALGVLRQSSDALALVLRKLLPVQQYELALQLYPCPGQIRVDTLTSLLQFCAADRELAEKLLQRFFKSHDNKEYQQALRSFAEKRLHDPSADTSLCVRIWHLTKSATLSNKLAPPGRLEELISCGATDLVAQMLVSASAKARKQVPASVFAAALRSLADSQAKHCVELLAACEHQLPDLSDTWDQIVSSCSVSERHHLLAKAKNCAVHARLRLPVALEILRSAGPASIVRQLRSTFEELLDELPAREAAELWSAMQQNAALPKQDLWSSALLLAARVTQVPADLGDWLFKQPMCSEKAQQLAKITFAQPGIWTKKQLKHQVLPLLHQWAAADCELCADVIWKLLAEQHTEQIPLQDQCDQLFKLSPATKVQMRLELYVGLCLTQAAAQFDAGKSHQAASSLRLAIYACTRMQAPAALCSSVLAHWKWEALSSCMDIDSYHKLRWLLVQQRDSKNPSALCEEAKSCALALQDARYWPQTAWKLLEFATSNSWQPPWFVVKAACESLTGPRASKIALIIRQHPDLKQLDGSMLGAIAQAGASYEALLASIQDTDQRRYLKASVTFTTLLQSPSIALLEEFLHELTWCSQYQASSLGTNLSEPVNSNWLAYQEYIGPLIKEAIPKLDPEEQVRATQLLNLFCEGWGKNECYKEAIGDILHCMHEVAHPLVLSQLGLFAVRLSTELSPIQNAQWLVSRFLSIASLGFYAGANLDDIRQAAGPLLGLIEKRCKLTQQDKVLIHNLYIYLNIDSSRYLREMPARCLDSVESLILLHLAEGRLETVLGCREVLKSHVLPLLAHVPVGDNLGQHNDPATRIVRLGCAISKHLAPHRKQLEEQGMLLDAFFDHIVDASKTPWNSSLALQVLRLRFIEESMLQLLADRPGYLAPFLRYFNAKLCGILMGHTRSMLFGLSGQLVEHAKSEQALADGDAVCELSRLIMYQPGLFEQKTIEQWRRALPAKHKATWNAHLKTAHEHSGRLNAGQNFMVGKPEKGAGASSFWRAGWWLMFAQTRIESRPELQEALKLHQDSLLSIWAIAEAMDVKAYPELLQDFLLNTTASVLIRSQKGLLDHGELIRVLCEGWADSCSLSGKLKLIGAFADRCITTADYDYFKSLLGKYFSSVPEKERSSALSQACLSTIRRWTAEISPVAIDTVMDSAATYFELTRHDKELDGELFKAGAGVASACLGLIMRFCSSSQFASQLLMLMSRLREMLKEHPVLHSPYWKRACRAMIEESYVQFTRAAHTQVSDVSLLFLASFGYPHQFPSEDSEELTYLSFWLKMLSVKGAEAVKSIYQTARDFEGDIPYLPASLPCAILLGHDPRDIWPKWRPSPTDMLGLEDLGEHYERCITLNPEQLSYFKERLGLIEQLQQVK